MAMLQTLHNAVSVPVMSAAAASAALATTAVGAGGPPAAAAPAAVGANPGAAPLAAPPLAAPPLAAPPLAAPPLAAPTPTGETTPPAPGEGSVGVFITPQSLLTFPGASGAVLVIWKVLGKIFSQPNSIYLPLLAASVVGMFMFYISMNPQGTRRDHVQGFGVAVINSFMLAASALGIGG